MKQDKIKTLTWAGLMCAIVVVTTMFAAIPIPGVQGAYANAGDAAVYASAHLLGWPWGVAAAAIGSMLADIILGSALYQASHPRITSSPVVSGRMFPNLSSASL